VIFCCLSKNGERTADLVSVKARRAYRGAVLAGGRTTCASAREPHGFTVTLARQPTIPRNRPRVRAVTGYGRGSRFRTAGTRRRRSVGRYSRPTTSRIRRTNLQIAEKGKSGAVTRRRAVLDFFIHADRHGDAHVHGGHRRPRFPSRHGDSQRRHVHEFIGWADQSPTHICGRSSAGINPDRFSRLTQLSTRASCKTSRARIGTPPDSRRFETKAEYDFGRLELFSEKEERDFPNEAGT